MQIKLKEILFLALLVLCDGWMGVLCGRVSHQYEQLFFPFSQALKSAAWVLGSLLLIVALTSLVSALLRPVRLLLFGHMLGVVAFLIGWRNGWVSFAGAFVYLGFMAFYSLILSGELERRLVFSLRPLWYEQRKLFVAMSLLLSMSFAWGYQLSVAQDTLQIPQGFKRAAEEAMLSSLQSQVQNQPGLDPAERTIYLEQARRSLEDTWDRLETSVQPYVRFIPLGLILPLYFLLLGLLDSLGWIPYILLWLVLRLFRTLGITQTIAETKEQKRLGL